MTSRRAMMPEEDKPSIATSRSQEKLVASIVALERFQIEINSINGRTAMLALVLQHLKTLLPIHLAGFFFPSGTEQGFSLETPMDPADAAQLARLVDRSIDSGVFGWALKHTRPAAFTAPASADCLILGALRTRQRVLGMFAAVMPADQTSGWDASITILATYLACAADAIFSEKLMAELQEHNRKLDDLVRQRTSQLEAAKDAAEVASRAKDTFLATISHELRTPLNAILGYSQRLRQHQELKPALAEQMETIHTSAEHLLSLINDLLDLAKAEASHIELYLEQADIRRMTREIAAIVRHRADEKQLSLQFSIDAETPETILADAKRLKQILINLLGNAIKFTARGVVELRIKRTGNRLRFGVIDTGCGIPADSLPQLGKPFHQLGDISQRAGGSGLGLAITKQLIQTMGSALHVKSESGKGSEFWFDLECGASPNPPASQVAMDDELKQPQTESQDFTMDRARVNQLQRMAETGDVLQLRTQLEEWIANSPESAAESRLLAMAKGFRIGAIKQFLNRQKETSDNFETQKTNES